MRHLDVDVNINLIDASLLGSMRGTSVPRPFANLWSFNVGKIEAAPIRQCGWALASAGKLISKYRFPPILMTENVRTHFAPFSFVSQCHLKAVENGPMKNPERLTVTPADHLECFVARTAKAVDCEIIVEAGRLNDAKPFHDGETGAVDNGKVLVRVSRAYCPRCVEVRGRDALDHRIAQQEPLPKAVGGFAAGAAVQQEPGFNQHVVGGDVIPSALQYRLSTGVFAISCYCSGKPDRGVDEDAHRRIFFTRLRTLRLPRVERRCSCQTASATIRSLSRAILVRGPPVTRLNTEDTSLLRLTSPKSWLSKRRTYSANDMTSSAGRACARRWVSGSIVICVRAFMMAPSCHHKGSEAIRCRFRDCWP